MPAKRVVCIADPPLGTACWTGDWGEEGQRKKTTPVSWVKLRPATAMQSPGPRRPPKGFASVIAGRGRAVNWKSAVGEVSPRSSLTETLPG